MALRRAATIEGSARSSRHSATPPARTAERASTTSTNRTSVFEEVLRLAAAGAEEADPAADPVIGSLSSKDLEEIRTLKSPPTVVRRTLEATWLLLNAAKAPGPSPPSWQRVQKMLCDMSFLTRMQSFDAGVLNDVPELTAFIAAEYFGHGDASATSRACRRSSAPNATSSPLTRATSLGRHSFYGGPIKNMSPPEPLTFQRVYRASHAAGALFRWCTTTIVDALSEDVVLDGKEEEDSASSLPEPPDDGRKAPPSSPPVTPAPPAPSAPPAPLAPPAPEPAEDRSVKLPPITAEPSAKPSAKPPLPSQQREVPRWTPLPKPEEAPRRVRPEPKVWKPDRHFELVAIFDLGNCAITPEGEATMQTVAATICMRSRLKLELVTSPDRIEHEALAASRVVAAADFFCSNGVRPSTSEEERVAKNGDPPGVVCCLLLDQDFELAQYLKNREEPNEEEDFKPSRELLYIVDWIESNFRMVKH